MTNSALRRSIGALQRRIRKRIVPFEQIASHLPRTGSLLEIGCGEGLVLEMLKSDVAPVVGVDFDPRKLGLARSRLADRKSIVLVENDAFAYLRTQKTGTWDCVLLVDTLSSFSINDQNRLLEEAVRVLAPDGQLLLKTIDGAAGWKTLFSKTLSALIYSVFRLSRSNHQAFYYQAEDELVCFFKKQPVSVTVTPLHRIAFHVVPHTLLLAKKCGGSGA
jgi:SAM-dependent methyltransferase